MLTCVCVCVGRRESDIFRCFIVCLLRLGFSDSHVETDRHFSLPQLFTYSLAPSSFAKRACRNAENEPVYTLGEQILCTSEYWVYQRWGAACGSVFPTGFVDGTFRAGSSFLQATEREKQKERKKREWKILINMCHWLQFDAYRSCYNNKQSSSICLNILPVNQVSWRKSVMLLTLCYSCVDSFCTEPEVRIWIWNPQALFCVPVVLSHPLSSHTPQSIRTSLLWNSTSEYYLRQQSRCSIFK